MLNPSEIISVPSDLNIELLLLTAVCFFLSKVTSSEKIVKLLDLKNTLFLSNILLLFKKFPLFADTEIFSFSLFIVKLGFIISNFGSIDKKFSFVTFVLILLKKIVDKNIAVKKINKINNVFLFILRKLFNLSS